MRSASDSRITGLTPAERRSERLGGGARKRPPLTITSLIDVIFLLLLFFMLATTFSRYQRMDIASSASGATTAAAAPPPLVRVAPGPAIDIDGEPVAADALGNAFARLKVDGATSVLILPRRAATVEDLVTVLAAARAAPLTARLLRRPGTGDPAPATEPSGGSR